MTELKVKKRDGKLEEFKKNKIFEACLAAGASRRAARIVSDQVTEKIYNEIPTSEIRDLAVNALEKYNPDWADSWRDYEKRKK